MTDIALDLRFSLFADEIPGMIEFEGEIRTGEYKNIECGRARVWTFDFEQAMSAGFSADELLDAQTQSTADYSILLRFDENTVEVDDFWSDDVLRALDETALLYTKLLVIDRIEILPDFRGHDFALKAMTLIVRNLGAGCGVVAIKPFPLQCESKRTAEFGSEWRERMQLEAFSNDEQIGKRRLCAHYARMGFKTLDNSEFMILDPARTIDDSGFAPPYEPNPDDATGP